MTPEYDAFISYRHNERDIRIASEIQTQLERFPIPKAIRETTGKKKINRIFRDQNELEITEDLSRALDEALEHSDFLIVILSPSYKESKWCLREIEQFLKTHDHDHILTVLSEGEPPSIFPDVLLKRTVTKTEEDGSIREYTEEIEPLACDYRMNLKEARRTELPRLVSAILGCEYDDLLRRNERYRRRRAASVLSLIGTAAVCAILWLLYSNARIEENYRQAQINESRTLASSSLSLMQDGQRLAAMELALSALPSETTDRPVTPEAMYALTKASLAYTLPYQTLQRKTIDLSADITSMLENPETGFLHLLDARGVLHTFDMSACSELTSFPLYTDEKEKDRNPVLAGNDIVTWTSLGLKSVTPEGDLNWTYELNFSGFGTAAVSDDGTCIAATDIRDLHVLGADGTARMVLSLPESENGYLEKLVFSHDNSLIAVSVNNRDDSRTVGIFSLSDRSYTPLETVHHLREMQFGYDNTLIVLSDDSQSLSFTAGPSSFMYQNNLDVFGYTAEGTGWNTTLPFSFLSRNPTLTPLSYRSDEVLVTVGNSVCGIDTKTGELLFEQVLSSSVLSVIGSYPAGTFALTDDGTIATIWPDVHQAVQTKQFPDRIDDIAVFPNDSVLFNRYALLREGNVLWYEPMADPRIDVYEGNGFVQPIDSAAFGDQRAAVLSDDVIALFDRTQKKEIARITLGRNETGILLSEQAVNEGLPLLRINTSDGTITAELRSMNDLSLIHQRTLAVKDFFGAESILNRLDEYNLPDARLRKSLLLKAYYADPSFLCFSGSSLYYLEQKTDLILHTIDVSSMEETELPIQLNEYLPTIDTTSAYAPSIRISNTGKHAMIIVQNPQDQLFYPAIMNLSDGSLHVLSEPVSPNTFLFDENEGGYTAVCGTDSILIFDRNYSPVSRIPFPGMIPKTLSLIHDRLYAIYPKGNLISYTVQGDVINTVQLSFDETVQPPSSSLRIRHYGDLLIVFIGDAADMLSLKDNGTLPQGNIEANTAAYCADTDTFFISSYNEDMRSTLLYPAELPRYSAEQLIQYAGEELN